MPPVPSQYYFIIWGDRKQIITVKEAFSGSHLKHLLMMKKPATKGFSLADMSMAAGFVEGRRISLSGRHGKRLSGPGHVPRDEGPVIQWR
jgi:hypothetical protein